MKDFDMTPKLHRLEMFKMDLPCDRSPLSNFSDIICR